MDVEDSICPVCDRRFGRVELVGGDRDRVRYIHADLVNRKELCRVFTDGQTERVEVRELPTV